MKEILRVVYFISVTIVNLLRDKRFQSTFC